MRIKIFREFLSKDNIENEVNAWLQAGFYYKVTDIKYGINEHQHFVLIRYEEA